MNVLVLLIVFTVSQWHCICTDGLDINFVSVGFKVVDTYKGKVIRYTQSDEETKSFYKDNEANGFGTFIELDAGSEIILALNTSSDNINKLKSLGNENQQPVNHSLVINFTMPNDDNDDDFEFNTWEISKPFTDDSYSTNSLISNYNHLGEISGNEKPKWTNETVELDYSKLNVSKTIYVLIKIKDGDDNWKNDDSKLRFNDFTMSLVFEDEAAIASSTTVTVIATPTESPGPSTPGNIDENQNTSTSSSTVAGTDTSTSSQSGSNSSTIIIAVVSSVVVVLVLGCLVGAVIFWRSRNKQNDREFQKVFDESEIESYSPPLPRHERSATYGQRRAMMSGSPPPLPPPRSNSVVY